MKIASVFLLDTLYHLDRLYSYRLPDALSDRVGEGSLVSVPFGSANHEKTAVIRSLSEGSAEEGEKLKELRESGDCVLRLNHEQLALCDFLKEYTFCTYGEAFRTMIPCSAYSLVRYFYAASPDASPDQLARLPEEQKKLFDRLKGRGDASFSTLAPLFGEETGRLLSLLKDKGLIRLYEKTKSAGKPLQTERYSLLLSPEDATSLLGKLRGEKQKKFLCLLAERKTLTLDEARTEGIGRAQTESFRKAGWIGVEKIQLFRDPMSLFPVPEKKEEHLNEEQQQAFDRLSLLADSGEPKCALLNGVTGSGKTHVILSLIDKVLASGRQALYLVPEISLTPQTLAIFRARYGKRIALFHSALSDGERFDSWRRMKNGDALVGIGTRSAVFAPFDRIGVIILDEEQEHTYKSDSSPRYHARDVARFRAAENKCLLLLASATPSLESAFRAESGSYELIRLTRRYNGGSLPETRFADLRDEAKDGGARVIGRELREEIGNCLSRGEQTILFLNRRGYHSFVSCPSCGKPLLCPHCSVAMTFHSTGRSDAENRVKNGYLACHYCGHREFLPEKCPSCGKGKLSFLGFGTQKAEEELQTLFPEAKVMRLDADTVSGKNAYEEKLTAFREHRADILLGTQMVVKGHDFPDVTLVGVLLADSSLYVSDFRANENTFSLLTQVTGRAGRAGKPGLSLIQTYCPEHTTLSFARAQDFGAFYRDEISLRKNYLFPPFCDIVLIELSSSDEAALLNACVSLSAMAVELIKNEFPDLRLQMFGPFESPLYKLRETYRMRLIFKCRFSKQARRFFSILRAKGGQSKKAKIGVMIDVNPAGLSV